jgi:hypothetical protein
MVTEESDRLAGDTVLSQAVWSWDAETMRRPSGPMATELIVFLWSRMVAGSLMSRTWPIITRTLGIARRDANLCPCEEPV